VRDVREALADAIHARTGALVLHGRQVGRAASAIPACASRRAEQREACARELGQQLAAGSVVAGALAGVGSVHLLELRVFEPRLLVVSVEETLEGELAVIHARAPALAERLFPQATPPPSQAAPPPWHRRWWVWVTVGVVVATAVAVPLAVTLRRNDDVAQLP